MVTGVEVSLPLDLSNFLKISGDVFQSLTKKARAFTTSNEKNYSLLEFQKLLVASFTNLQILSTVGLIFGFNFFSLKHPESIKTWIIRYNLFIHLNGL